MLIDIDTVKALSSRFVSNKSTLSRISSDFEPVRTRVLEITKHNSGVFEPEIKRLLHEFSQPENFDSDFYRSNLLQCEIAKKTAIDRPNAIVSKLDSLFAHLDEVLTIDLHNTHSKLQIEMQAAMEDLETIEKLLFDKINPLPRKDPYSSLYGVFYDLKDVFLSIGEVLEDKGLSAYIRPRKAVSDALANHKETPYHRSMFNSPESIQRGYIASVVYQYLRVPHESMIPNIDFQHHITSGFVRSIESYQKSLFAKLRKSLAEDNFELFKQKFDLKIDQPKYQQIITKPNKNFEAYVLAELGDLSKQCSYDEVERSVKRVLVLDALREMQLLKDLGLEQNMVNFTRRIYAKTSDRPEASLKAAMADIKCLDPYIHNPDSLLDGLLERGGYSQKAKDHIIKLAAEAQSALREGHFISWDANKQVSSSDPILQNQFLYFKENIFDFIQERFQARNKGQSIEDALDQSFKNFSRKPFKALINEITQSAFYIGLSKLDLIQFRYVATELFKLHREMNNQHTTYSALKRHLFKSTT